MRAADGDLVRGSWRLRFDAARLVWQLLKRVDGKDRLYAQRAGTINLVKSVAAAIDAGSAPDQPEVWP